MYGGFPDRRPAALRRRSLPARTQVWRLDDKAPRDWTWDGFPHPHNRFDPISGTFRVRYAAWSVEGAFRERYLSTGRFVPEDHAGHWLVRLVASRPHRVLDLRTELNLDALDVDDRISTGHERAVWEACHELTDAARGWWEDLDGVVYRSRTTPEASANLAFWSADGWELTGRPLTDCAAELDDLVLRHQFTIGFDW